MAQLRHNTRTDFELLFPALAWPLVSTGEVVDFVVVARQGSQHHRFVFRFDDDATLLSAPPWYRYPATVFPEMGRLN